MPVIVKLTPNVTNILGPARAAKAGGADAVSLINTINSIMSVDLDVMAPTPTVGGKGTHGGYCGPAVKPIALNMVAEIARDVETLDLPISGIGGVTTWRDAAEFLSLGAGNVQVCTAAMTYGFKIIDEMTAGLSDWMDEKGYASVSDVVGRAVPNVTDWQYLNLNYVTKARIDQEACIKCGRCFAPARTPRTRPSPLARAGSSRLLMRNASPVTSASMSALLRAALPWNSSSPATWTNGRASSWRPSTATGPHTPTTPWPGPRSKRRIRLRRRSGSMTL